MAGSDHAISELKKINEEFQSKLNRIKTAYVNLEARMESYQLEMSERERAIIELQLDNDGLKDYTETLLKKISHYEAKISQYKESNTWLRDHFYKCERLASIAELKLDNKILKDQNDQLIHKVQTQMQGQYLTKCEQAITELKLDNANLTDHNEELLTKISEYEVLISQLKESNARLNIRSRLNDSIRADDQKLKKRKSVFQWTLQNRGCKEAWLIAKRFKRQGFSNAWIPAQGFTMCQNCSAKKEDNQCSFLRN